jgi:hypothetical protein
LDVAPDQVIFRLAEALGDPKPPPEIQNAPAQEVIEPSVDLEAIPFLTHYAGDGGAYATAAVAFINDPETGPNASYHRLMRLDRSRIVAGSWAPRRNCSSRPDIARRDLHGLPQFVWRSPWHRPWTWTSQQSHKHSPTPVVSAPTASAHSRGRARAEGGCKELVSEGLQDLTALDFVRRQPVIEIDQITHRRNLIYQALLGRLEHRYTGISSRLSTPR